MADEANPVGTWTFFSPDGVEILSCLMDQFPIVCTEWIAGSIDDELSYDNKDWTRWILNFPDLIGKMKKHPNRKTTKIMTLVDVHDSEGKPIEHRLYTEDGYLLLSCPSSQMIGTSFLKHQAKEWGGKGHYELRGYCMDEPSMPCPPSDRSCGLKHGQHCEEIGSKRKCVNDTPLRNGDYKNWSSKGMVILEGTARGSGWIGELITRDSTGERISTYDDAGQRVASRQQSTDGTILWDAKYEKGKFVSIVRSPTPDTRLHIRKQPGEYPPFFCEYRTIEGDLTASGPCSVKENIFTGEVLKQKRWREIVRGKKRIVRYLNGMTVAERRKAKRMEQKAAREKKRLRREAEARGECSFNGYDGVECELKLCAKIARKVRAMRPRRRHCMSQDEPLASYSEQWSEAIRAIDTYAGHLKRMGNATGYRRLVRRVKKCSTPKWFRSCSN